jgi:hypothetical protein
MLIATQLKLCSCTSYGMDRGRMVHSAFRADSISMRVTAWRIALASPTSRSSKPASARDQPIEDRSVDLDPRADAAADLHRLRFDDAGPNMEWTHASAEPAVVMLLAIARQTAFCMDSASRAR